jgi:hypothetical protein
MSAIDKILARPPHTAYLARVPSTLLHPGAGYTDTCVVEVLARPAGGSARPAVRCIFERTTGHVPAEALHRL